jgi:putative sigma-54 modulation protein
VKISITGRHLGVTESMKTYAREKVEKLGRYFDRPTRAHVTMDVERETHRVEIVLDLVRGTSLVGKAEAPDMYAALDLAEQKLAQQVRRFKQRLKDHHRGEGRAGAPEPLAPEGTAPNEEVATYEDVIEELRGSRDGGSRDGGSSEGGPAEGGSDEGGAKG